MIKKFSIKIQRKPLISIEEAGQIIENGNIKILNCSFVLPPNKQEKNEIFKAERIKSAQFFDVDQISDKSTNLPHMMPTNEIWIEHMNSLKINTNNSIVLYDDYGIVGACRAYFMFKVFNPSQDVYILNTNFSNFKAKLPHLIDSSPLNTNNEISNLKKNNDNNNNNDNKQDIQFQRSDYHIADLKLVQQASYVEHYLQKNTFAIIDARHNDRFLGKVPEPREGLRSGNIKGSKNMFFKNLLNEDWSFKENSQLEEIYKQNGLEITDLKKKLVINSCGSGMTACVNYVAQVLMGLSKITLYDGSWTEYGQIQEYDEIKMADELKQKVVYNNNPEKVYLEKDKDYSFCTCGRSEKQPFCDSRHRGTPFKSQRFRVDQDGEYYLCICKQSNNFPFCDGTHQKL